MTSKTKRSIIINTHEAVPLPADVPEAAPVDAPAAKPASAATGNAEMVLAVLAILGGAVVFTVSKKAKI